VAVSVTGLGTLTNRVAAPNSHVTVHLERAFSLAQPNLAMRAAMSKLTTINNKPLYYQALGQSSAPPAVFVHGLGSTNEMFFNLINTLGVTKSHSVHLFDFEGHGLSPTSPLSRLSIDSLAEDLNGVFAHANITSGALLVAHSMGCLIASQFALAHPEKVARLILVGPHPSPRTDIDRIHLYEEARLARDRGMSDWADYATNGTIGTDWPGNPLIYTVIRLSMLGQDSEGYAKACTALAEAKAIDYGSIQARTLVITGSKDKVPSPELCEDVAAMKGRAILRVLDGVGHWQILEDLPGVAGAVRDFLEDGQS
jgi:pimeloyl-ACP methyl ester carboxylesterase